MSLLNYIKAHRTRWNLTQSELGYLIGQSDGAKVCNLERGSAQPNAEELVILELLFRTASSRLLPGYHKQAITRLLERLSMLEQQLTEASATRSSMHKLNEIRKVRREIAIMNQHNV